MHRPQAMSAARHVVLVGPMGAGKTSIGRCLARHLGLDFIDSDHEIEERTGAAVPTIFACEGEGGFRARERQVLEELLAGPAAVIATGGGAVLDPATRRLLAARGFVVHLHADVATQLARLARDRSRPLLAVEDREAALRMLALQRDPLYAEIADLAFDTAQQATAEAARRLADLVDPRWREAGPRLCTEPAA